MADGWFVLGLAAMLQVSAAAQAAAPESAAQLWNRVVKLQEVPEPELKVVNMNAVPTKEYFEGNAARSAAIADALITFIERYPADSRRWEAVAGLMNLYRPIYREIGAVQTEGWEAAIHDEAAERAWEERIDALAEQMRDAPGASAQQREAAYRRWVGVSRRAIDDGDEQRVTASMAEFRRRIYVVRQKFPDASQNSANEWTYLSRLRRLRPDAVVAYLEATTQDRVADIAKWAEGELAVEALREEPVELAFTAVDGREVDLARLRGKVVLLEFWATWCGPCRVQMPKVLQVYNRYHDQGLEVVAISLDRKNDRQKLVDYVSSNGLPWPQYFDAENDTNRLAEQYGVVGIPAMFLFNRRGLLVTIEARAEKLVPQIERLLQQ